MRKAHYDAIQALRMGLSKEIGPRDTIYIRNIDDAMYKVWLYHGSAIVKVLSNGDVFVNWQGWYTHSTTERIRAMAAHLGLAVPAKGGGWIKLTA